jgi:hypothetical protein
MWRLWRKANQFHKLPSEVFGEEDALAAWMLDNCVLTFGTLVENMLHETDEVGTGEHRQMLPRYTIHKLLDPTFIYPDNPAEQDNDKSMNLDGMAGVQGLAFDEVR